MVRPAVAGIIEVDDRSAHRSLQLGAIGRTKHLDSERGAGVEQLCSRTGLSTEKRAPHGWHGLRCSLQWDGADILSSVAGPVAKVNGGWSPGYDLALVHAE